jgi:hypothetical protein
MFAIALRQLVKTRPWISLTLLLATYANLGWVISSSEFSKAAWLPLFCNRSLGGLHIAEHTHQDFCSLVVEYHLLGGILAIGWILLASFAFMSPLTSFSRFITRFFKSDTVAFLSIVVLAGMASLILFWLHVFIQILIILAAEALARIDIQTLGLGASKAFWILTIVSLTGLGLGWTAQLMPSEVNVAFWFSLSNLA